MDHQGSPQAYSYMRVYISFNETHKVKSGVQPSLKFPAEKQTSALGRVTPCPTPLPPDSQEAVALGVLSVY